MSLDLDFWGLFYKTILNDLIDFDFRSFYKKDINFDFGGCFIGRIWILILGDCFRWEENHIIFEFNKTMMIDIGPKFYLAPSPSLVMTYRLRSRT